MLLGVVSAVHAGQQGGQRPAAYLEYGAGGSQNAMGGAAVGERNDPACGFWNPAGLSGLRGFQIEDQYTILPLGQQLNFISLANGFRGQFFYGFSSFIYSAGGDLEARVAPTLTPDSVFGDVELTFLPSVAFRLDWNWSVGGNVKFMIQSINNYTGYGFGEDLGIQYRLNKFTTFGFVAQDPFTLFNYDNSTQTIAPPTLKAGLTHREESLKAKVNFDLEWSTDLGLRPRLGLEWQPVPQVLALRGGLWVGNLTGGNPGDSVSLNPSAGFGVLVPLTANGDGLVELDYTILPDPIVSGNFLHQIDLVGEFL